MHLSKIHNTNTGRGRNVHALKHTPMDNQGTHDASLPITVKTNRKRAADSIYKTHCLQYFEKLGLTLVLRFLKNY